MMGGVFKGLGSSLRAFGAIVKYGLWKYVFATGLMGLAVAYFCFKLIWNQSDKIGDWLSSKYKWEKGTQVVDFASDWIVWIILLVLTVSIYKYIMQILCAPIMSMASEKIEHRLIGESKSTPFSIAGSIKSLVRGMRIAIRNLSKELILTGLLLGASVVFPPAAVVTSVLIFLIQAYYAGFGNMDFYMERHLNFRESKQFVRKNRGMAVANGAIFLGLLTIPILGWFLAPIIAGIGASLAVHETL